MTLRIFASIAVLSILSALSPLFGAMTARADELVAVPSSTEIEENENLSIEFRTTVENLSGSVGRPMYEAPDFDEINAYAAATQVQTSYINGKLETRQSQSVVSILRPKRKGILRIRNIHAVIGGKTVRAQDLKIEVRAAGTAGARQGFVSGGPPQRGQLPQAGIHRSRPGSAGTFFLKTEPAKLKAYKGEQIILTYAIYTRVPLVNVQVERFPNLSGFLKEDIDIPVLRGRWDFAPSVVNGHEYRRAPLAQYAIFPLKEGTLPLDVFTGKFSYQADNRFMADEDDPFGMLNNFFRAMQTSTETRSSDRVSIEVMPLPGAGQPANFSGLVGDFNITAVVDKYTVKVGEPLNVKVKLEGRGHAGSLERLNVNWPQDFELYEDKSSTQFLKTGYSERMFEYMLIPKTKGKVEIPPIEVSMFHPDTRTYQTRKTAPISIEVLEGSLGNIYIAKTKPGSAPAAPAKDIRYWMDGDQAPAARAGQLTLVSRGAVAASAALAFMGLWSLALPASESRRKTRQKAGQALLARITQLEKGGANAGPVETFGEIEGLLGELLELRFGILIGSLTRAEVRQTIASHPTATEVVAKRIEHLLELCENQRYAPGAGDRTQAKLACEELARIADELGVA